MVMMVLFVCWKSLVEVVFKLGDLLECSFFVGITGRVMFDDTKVGFIWKSKWHLPATVSMWNQVLKEPPTGQ